MSALRLTITGMHCGNCVTKVERALKAVPGTLGAAVDLQLGSADVQFDEARASVDRYVQAVQSVGYHAHVAA
jgi:copper chaperone CopZ